MKYLCDTNVLIDHLRGKKKIDLKVIVSGVAISIITLAELLYGAQKSSRKQESLKVIDDFIRDLSVKIINLDKSIILEYSKIKAGLEKKGERLDDFDLLIGSTAKVSSLTLVTGNVRHFKRIPGLKLF